MIPSEGKLNKKETKNLKPSTEKKHKNSIFYYTKPRVRILICISKQITDKCCSGTIYSS